MSFASNFPPAFTFRPPPEPESLTDFVESTGINGFLVDGVKKLYEVSSKPENPIEWFRLYFKHLLSEMKEQEVDEQDGDGDGGDEGLGLPDVEQSLKDELAGIELALLEVVEEETQNNAIISKLEHEVKDLRSTTAKNYYYEDLHKYSHLRDDYHYRIRPDPSYQASRGDQLLSDNESGGSGGERLEDPIVELPPDDPNNPNEANNSEDKVYDDYPSKYFVKRMSEPVVEEVVTEEEPSEDRDREYEYDGSSEEDGESEGSRSLSEEQ